MAPYSVLVTGANRGIGLALVKEFLKNKDIGIVIATTRNPEKAKDLYGINDDRLRIVRLDLNDDDSIAEAVSELQAILGDKGLNVLVNNAAVLISSETKQKITRETLISQFQPNVFGTVILSQALLPLLEKASSLHQNEDLSINRAAILNISSGAGSIGQSTFDCPYGGSRLFRLFSYRASKASLNMITRTMGIDLVNESILVCCFCPGPVDTEMHPDKEHKDSLLKPEESASVLVNSFFKLNSSHNGNFYDRNLESIPF
ncbi:hypothetical protein WR25_11501 [Diploscapter pachys]|uniref:Uncharacterized protein n=1 Tax=Diploscapter pachys TaxID=2018661 RepID=A0A2A2L6Z3_9BILA|nr:hypothetical protein WR25_11501 [Diploscapter pachys]